MVAQLKSIKSKEELFSLELIQKYKLSAVIRCLHFILFLFLFFRLISRNIIYIKFDSYVQVFTLYYLKKEKLFTIFFIIFRYNNILFLRTIRSLNFKIVYL